MIDNRRGKIVLVCMALSNNVGPSTHTTANFAFSSPSPSETLPLFQAFTASCFLIQKGTYSPEPPCKLKNLIIQLNAAHQLAKFIALLEKR